MEFGILKKRVRVSYKIFAANNQRILLKSRRSFFKEARKFLLFLEGELVEEKSLQESTVIMKAPKDPMLPLLGQYCIFKNALYVHLLERP